ncbi:hypothetical protein HELRODRAFT_165657 [Helobdella robusta]|uniref:Uncharacterized protein n=1 Tax=Helobdella robusta TaxID=6412 RepID=T1EX50_HELRO|nr:hypothetical protein HELRODRAFT_165657 [Helobdella robusta]ESN91604.1 hypothetical protein HELRODRAFT_165657 [Helobdella robusta]
MALLLFLLLLLLFLLLLLLLLPICPCVDDLWLILALQRCNNNIDDKMTVDIVGVYSFEFKQIKINSQTLQQISSARPDMSCRQQNRRCLWAWHRSSDCIASKND